MLTDCALRRVVRCAMTHGDRGCIGIRCERTAGAPLMSYYERPSMGSWNVDTSTPGLLRLTLEGRLSCEEMSAFVTAHNRAIDAFGASDYKVWCDLSRMLTLDQECVRLFERAKLYSNSHKNFRGSAVLVASALIAAQHRRTSLDGGVMSTELISQDVKALEQHLRTVYRQSE